MALWCSHFGYFSPSEMSLGFELNSVVARQNSGFAAVAWPVAAAGVLDFFPAGLIGWPVAG